MFKVGIEILRGIKYYSDLVLWIVKWLKFYFFKIIFNIPILIGMLSSSYILAILMSGNVNFVSAYAENLNYNIKNLLPYMIVCFFLLVTWEIARLNFKSIYFKGQNGKGKKNFIRSFFGIGGVFGMTAILVAVAYLGQSQINEKISKKINSEIMKEFNNHPKIISNNKKIAWYKKRVRYMTKYLKKSVTAKNKATKLKYRKMLPDYKTKISKLRDSNKLILQDISVLKLEKLKSLEIGNIAIIIMIEILMIIPFLMDILNFKLGDKEDRESLRIKYKSMENNLIKKNILAPAKPKKVGYKKNNSWDKF